MLHKTQECDFYYSDCEQPSDGISQLPHLVSNGDWRMSKLQKMIDGQEGRLGWRVTDACQKLNLGITASHASRLFRQEFGLGIREYKKLKRLQAAAARLETTSLSAKEIAADLGYRTPADFYRQFKQAFRVTPLEFRNISRACGAAHRIAG
jgi:AraC-like DNA-binding protein